MKAIVFVLLAACLAGVFADDISADLASVVGSDKAAIVSKEPESAQAPMSKEECLSQCDASDADPNSSANINDIKREMNTVGKELIKAKEAVKRAEECQTKLEELRAQLAELQRQKNELAGDSKQTLLENKKDLEERSSTHVGSMIDTLSIKLEELRQAEAVMSEKNRLTKEALAAAGPDPVIEPLITTEEPRQVALSDELAALHGAMVSSLDQHSQRVMNMTGDIPGLHDIEYGVKMSKTADALSKAIDENKGAAAIAKTMDAMGLMMENGVVTPKEKAKQEAYKKEIEAQNKNLDKMSGATTDSFKEVRDLAKLRSTIKKLKKKLRK